MYNKLHYLILILLFHSLAFGQDQDRALSGNYLYNGKTCKLHLKIEDNKHFTLDVNNESKFSGVMKIRKEQDTVYLNFDYIEALYRNDTIVFQNYGNSMNPYIHFEECDEKFIHLVKDKNAYYDYSTLIYDLDNDGIKDTLSYQCYKVGQKDSIEEPQCHCTLNYRRKHEKI